MLISLDTAGEGGRVVGLGLAGATGGGGAVDSPPDLVQQLLLLA